MKDLIKLMQEYRKIKGYTDGGEVTDDTDRDEATEESKKQLSTAKKSHKKLMDEMETDITDPDEEGYADGGQVDNGTYDPATNTQTVDFDEGSTIIGQRPEDAASEPEEMPATEGDVTEQQSPEDKELEDKMANEDFEAGEKADESGDEETPEEDSSKATPSKEEAKPEESSAARLVASVKPQPSELEKALAQRRRGVEGSEYSKWGNVLGAAIAGAKPMDPSMFNGQEKIGNLGLEEYQAKVKDQQNDPNSEMSKVMKQYLKGKGFAVPEKSSAADLLKVAPFLAKDQALQNSLQKTLLTQQVKISEGEKNRALREKTAEQSAGQRDQQIKAYTERTKAQVGSTNDRKMQSRLDALNKDLAQGGGSVVNQNRTAMQRANNLFLTNGVDPHISEKDIDSLSNDKLNQVNRIGVVETGIELNRLLTGSGVPAQNALNKLIPNNMNMTGTQIKDYITNKLNPAQQAQALKAYMKIAARVRDQSKTNVSSYYKQRLSGAKEILDYYPEQAKAMKEEAKSQGFDVGDLEKAAAQKSKGAHGQHQPGDIVTVKGKDGAPDKQYKVGADGDSLEDVQ